MFGYITHFLYNKTTARKKDQRLHTIRCQIKARTALVKDGMSEEEALIAVEPPLKAQDESLIEGNVGSDNETNNHFKLRKCYIRIQRLNYLEQALKKCCQTLLMKRDRSGCFMRKLIW